MEDDRRALLSRVPKGLKARCCCRAGGALGKVGEGLEEVEGSGGGRTNACRYALFKCQFLALLASHEIPQRPSTHGLSCSRLITMAHGLRRRLPASCTDLTAS